MSGTITSSVPALGRARSIVERAWDRIDRSMLRLQGRVDTPSYDRWLPYGFAIINATTLIVLVLARYNQLDHGLETAKYAQAAWQIGEDLKPITTLSGGNILAEQGSLILYPLGVLTSVFPRIETLLVIKSLALAITVIPLWRLARRHGRLGIGATSTIVFVYSIYTYVHNMNIADFAPAVLAVPALMWAVLLGFDARKRLMTLAIVFVLCCRADLGLAVAGLGILLVMEHYRDLEEREEMARARFETAEDLRRVGLLAFVLGLGWFIVVMYTLQRSGNYAFLAPYAEFGDTPLGVLGGIISHPVKFAQSVGSQANFQILVTLLAPVLFLPLTAPRYLMPAVPLYVLYMGADVQPGRLREAAQSVPMTVFVLVATVFALKRTGRILVRTVRVERRIVLALLLTALIFFIRDSTTTPYTQPWDWGGRDATDLARVDAVAMIPLGEPVRSTASALPMLSERLGVYNLDADVGKFDGADPAVAVLFGERIDLVISEATADVDWLIVDIDADLVDATAADIGTFRSRLATAGWALQGDPGQSRIEVYEFTGIVASVPVPQEEILFGFGDPDDEEGSDDEDGADEDATSGDSDSDSDTDTDSDDESASSDESEAEPDNG